MAHHARIEEISDGDPDSDPEDMDPSDFDPSGSIISPGNIPSTSTSTGTSTRLQPTLGGPVSATPAADRERFKTWQCLYPIYFDSARSRAEGRRVGKDQAVPNPLARDIVDAVGSIGGLQIAFEPGKTHPKDWANPGRVRVLVKVDGRAVSRFVKNKHHLYNLVASYLKSHPTTEASPLRLPIHGLPTPKTPIPPPAVPRGWKMNSIIPLHSPAMSGGGVSDNFFKEMMAEMQGQAGGAISDSGGEGKKKKDKKKSKA